ncbi:MAG: choice-of-anchor D domain-containing protein [Lysobacterales bacterium]|nr:MAG: choice-of-anchor D domain-containing protein [Xanthomonadales bacterium]
MERQGLVTTLSLLAFCAVAQADVNPSLAVAYAADVSAGVVIAGREWRQLKDTTYVTWNEVAAVCPTDGVTPCNGSIHRSQDGAYIDVTGWTWARNADLQPLWEEIVQPGTLNFATPYSVYSKMDDPDIARALSAEPGWFAPTMVDIAARSLYGLSAELGATGAYRPWMKDGIPGRTDSVNLSLCCIPVTGRQWYTGAWLFRPYGTAVQLASLKLKSAEVAGCKSVTGTVTLSAPAPAGGVVVTLSDTLAAATVPASVKLLEGATSKTFTVKTVPVSARQSGSVSAALGNTTLSQAFAVRPIGMSSITLTPTTVVGGQPVAGTAKLECKAGPGPITVALASTDAAVARPVAASVVVPQGLQSAPFDVTTSVALARTKATLSATASGIARTKILYVTPAAVVSPTSLKFGSVAVGTASAPLVATLTNKGAASFVIDGIAVTGTYASWFPMTENCAASLAPGASCTISVAFKPLAAASRSAKVTIATSATATPLAVSLSGTGVQ